MQVKKLPSDWKDRPLSEKLQCWRASTLGQDTWDRHHVELFESTLTFRTASSSLHPDRIVSVYNCTVGTPKNARDGHRYALASLASLSSPLALQCQVCDACIPDSAAC